jgi:DNA-binding transcriptional regulator GbsR (MarR family)
MAATDSAGEALTGAVGALGARFVLHWGEMGTRWGVSRTVSQLHALLYLLGRPMHAEEIAAVLQVARSNVSTSIRELQNWDLVKVTHLAGDRRDHFETVQDPWELMRILVRERKAREFDPTVAFLRGCVGSREFAREDAGTQKRLRETLTLMEALAGWTNQMLAMDNAFLKRLIRLGARVQAFLKAA